jgi:hypothetical protein
MNPALTYPRGTTYSLTHTYTAPQYLGVTLIFTVKTVKNDSDITDITNAIMTPKVITMSGSSFPQTTPITIDPGDVSVNTKPGKDYYSIKVIDTQGNEYIVASGVFNLTAFTTNEITS